MPKPRHWRKEYPYYKVQVLDEIINSWKDERKPFDTVDEAQEHIAKNISPKAARIIIVESNGRRVLES